ncbi:MAG: thioredoxin-dependent thiol peroxidase [Bacteroidia bacterium]|nr:thioredoxin-dependent thiol peroxidase [Bacteroidia bacterium]
MGKYLEVGTNAPDFTTTDQNGTVFQLKNYLGKKIVLYFYPKDDTPGCTKEACNLRDHYEVLQNHGIQIFGISTDDATSHQKFIQKYNLPFPLLLDTDKTIVQTYQAWGEKSMFGKKYMGVNRVTYLIDENGKIAKVISKVEVENHANQILKAWGLL